MGGQKTFFIVVFLLSGVLFWFYKETQKAPAVENNEPAAAVSVASERPAKAAPPVADSNSESSEGALRKQQLVNEMQTLRTEIEQGEVRRGRMQSLLAELQSRIQPVAEADAFYSEIRDYNQEIQDFLGALRNNDFARSEIQRRTTDAMSEQDNQALVLKDQLDENIRQQQNLIRQTQEQIGFWQGNYSYTNLREAKLEELQTSLVQQQLVLRDLTEQRAGLSAQILVSFQSLQALKERVLEELQTESEDLRQEVQLLRSEVQELQNTRYQTQMSQMTLQGQIKQLRADLTKQEQLLLELKENQQKKEEFFKTLR